MPQNPFNRTLDWAVQGKYARVRDEGRTYQGWIDRVHHGRGSVVMHDVSTDDGEELGSVFVRNPAIVEVLKPKKRVEYRDLNELSPHPEHDGSFTPKDDVIQRCYRNKYAGSFPVVREDGTIINGHKRVAAARIAGLKRHPVEVIDVTDEQALELLELAHRGESGGGNDESEESKEDGEKRDDSDSENSEESE